MKRVKISDTVEVFNTNGYQGYGYQILKRSEVERISENKIRYKRELLFHSYNKKVVLELMTQIEETKTIPETWPDTSTEIPQARIFKFDSKHYTYHFDAQTPEKLEKAARRVLKEESPYYPPDEPKNESGIETIEELEKIGIDSLKKEVEEKFNKYQKQLKNYNYHLSDWNNLCLVLEGKGELNNVLDALDKYEVDRYEIIDLDEV